MNKKVVVLVVGWCPPTQVDEGETLEAISVAYNEVERNYPDHEVVLVSGLTDVGVMKHAYREAVNRGWFTSGYACEKAADFELFPVDEKNIVGQNWGDESESFVQRATQSGHPFGIINIAGGEQAEREVGAVIATGGFSSQYNLERK